jgi:hypothetical protein
MASVVGSAPTRLACERRLRQARTWLDEHIVVDIDHPDDTRAVSGVADIADAVCQRFRP